MLQLTQIEKSFSSDGVAKPVLSNFTHTFAQGSVWQLYGASGRGKTTLLRILMGLETVDGGSYHKPQHTRFAAVFQEDRLLPWCSAVENVRFVCAPETTAQQVEDTLAQLLDRADLHRPVQTLSGGMKRRVALVRALLSPSDCLILDEPFTGLDPENVQRALDLLQSLRGNRTVLFVSHETQLSGAKPLYL